MLELALSNRCTRWAMKLQSLPGSKRVRQFKSMTLCTVCRVAIERQEFGVEHRAILRAEVERHGCVLAHSIAHGHDDECATRAAKPLIRIEV